MPPLFRNGTTSPATESPSFYNWSLGSDGSLLKTYGLWVRTLPLLGGLVGYAGRFVYEQNDGQATDNCHFALSQYPKVTSTLSGGGWYVTQNGDWGYDQSGFNSQFISYYQNYYKPNNLSCTITGPQEMYMDARMGPVPYTVDTQMPADITPTELLVGMQPNGGSMVKACENYPSLKGKCK